MIRIVWTTLAAGCCFALGIQTVGLMSAPGEPSRSTSLDALSEQGHPVVTRRDRLPRPPLARYDEIALRPLFVPDRRETLADGTGPDARRRGDGPRPAALMAALVPQGYGLQEHDEEGEEGEYDAFVPVARAADDAVPVEISPSVEIDLSDEMDPSIETNPSDKTAPMPERFAHRPSMVVEPDPLASSSSAITRTASIPDLRVPDIRLLGISRTDARSRAVIRMVTEGTATLAPGESLGDWHLVSIGARNVILESDRARLIVSMELDPVISALDAGPVAQ